MWVVDFLSTDPVYCKVHVMYRKNAMYYEAMINHMGYAADGTLTSDFDLWDTPSIVNIFVTNRDDEDEIQEMLDIDIPIEHSHLAYRLFDVVEAYVEELEDCPPEMTADEWLAQQYEADARAAALEDQDVF